MFSYSNLTEVEKQIILLMGDYIKLPPIEAHTNIKNRKTLYKEFFNKSYSEEKFEEILDSLYYKGLVSYVPASIMTVNNISKDAEEQLKKHYSLEKGWKEQDPFIRLTIEGERTITGTMIYHQILKEKTNEEYEKLRSITIALQEKHKILPELEKKIDNFHGKSMQLMAIFIAIFTFIIGNSGILITVKDRDFTEIINLILIINGTMLLGIGFLMIIIKSLIFNEKAGAWKVFWIIIFPILLIIIGVLLSLFN
ncbi:hypothetical protein [Virgibacillus ainsalahensis]